MNLIVSYGCVILRYKVRSIEQAGMTQGKRQSWVFLTALKGLGFLSWLNSAFSYLAF